MFWKKDDENSALVKAKAMARIGIRAILRNNPKYAAEIGMFCAVVTGDLSQAIADKVAEELAGMKDQMLAADIRDALQVAGLPDFDNDGQLDIIREICSLAN